MKSNIKSDEKGVVASKKTNKALPRNRIRYMSADNHETEKKYLN